MGKRIRILTSSDVHGVLFPYEYAKGRGRNWGLAKLSGLIRSLRGPDTILIDNGDTLEGSPLSFYHYAKRPPLVSPMTAAMPTCTHLRVLASLASGCFLSLSRMSTVKLVVNAVSAEPAAE